MDFIILVGIGAILVATGVISPEPKEDKVEGSLHIPRGMLEFWIDPNSAYYKQGKIDPSKEIVLFCAGGLRSALAAKSLKDMGFKNVSHVDGGFSAIKDGDFEIS